MLVSPNVNNAAIPATKPSTKQDSGPSRNSVSAVLLRLPDVTSSANFGSLLISDLADNFINKGLCRLPVDLAFQRNPLDLQLNHRANQIGPLRPPSTDENIGPLRW